MGIEITNRPCPWNGAVANRYVKACCGDPSSKTMGINRELAVVDIERFIKIMEGKEQGMKLPALDVAMILRHSPDERVITFLRREFPGKWRYRKKCFDWVRGNCQVVAHLVAHLANRYDGDDSFVTYLHIGPPHNKEIFWRGVHR